MGSRGPAARPSPDPEVSMPHPCVRCFPPAVPRPGSKMRRGTAWGRGGAGSEGHLPGIDWMAWVLLIDSQDSGLLDLLPSLKQLMEAPLQTGMVKHKGCDAPRDYNSRRAQRVS